MEYFKIEKGKGPVIGAAIHNGHFIRKEVEEKLILSDGDRYREEDPFTERFIDFAPTKVIVNNSRFEFDVNRPEDKSVYMAPEDAWGLKIWKEAPPEELVAASVMHYKKFYKEIKALIGEYVNKYEKVFIYDVHSYNHMRSGPGDPPADQAENPEINIGSGNIDGIYWRELIDDFIQDLSGRHLDVRENVKFKGGFFSKWISGNFGNNVCILSVEIKKIYMDEWTGKVYNDRVELIRDALSSTMPSVLKNLKKAADKP